VLIEVPVMLSVVRIVLATRRWYEGNMTPRRLNG
jgi:ACR3 family arsenite efflux pump ArsB